MRIFGKGKAVGEALCGIPMTACPSREMLLEWSRAGFKKMIQNLSEIKEMKQYQKTFLFTKRAQR